jgi:hypothetical protein
MSRTRDLAAILGATEQANTNNNSLLNVSSSVGLDSAQVSTIAAASSLTVYDSIGALPTSGLTAGDQAYITASSRLYLSTGSGWYNVALINATPTLSLSPSGTIALSSEGVAQTVTVTATDSDNADASLVLSVESGGDFFKLATLSQDSSVFTITPRSEDSATALGFDGSATLTFKASDGVAFGAGTNTFTLAFSAIVDSSSDTMIGVKATGNTLANTNRITYLNASQAETATTETGTIDAGSFSPYKDESKGYCISTTTNDYAIDTSASFAFTGDWTFETWIRTTQTDEGIMFCNYPSGNSAFNALKYNAGRLTLAFTSGTNDVAQTTGQVINDGEWHWIVYDRYNNNIKIYVDGVEVKTQAFSENSTDLGTWVIGQHGNYTSGYFQAFADYFGMRAVNGASVYSNAASLTMPTQAPGIHSSGTTEVLMGTGQPYIDNFSTSQTAIPHPIYPASGTVYEGKFTKPETPFDGEPWTAATHGGSMYFPNSNTNGSSNNYITLPTTTDFNFDGAFSLEFWYHPTDRNPVIKVLVEAWGNSNLQIGYDTPGSGGRDWYFYQNGSNIIASNGENLFPGAWHHFVVCRDGSNNMSMFVNGKRQGSAVTNSTAFNFSGAQIHKSATGGGYASENFTADMRWIKGSTPYDPTQTTITVPTQAHTHVTNTKLLMNNTSDFAIYSNTGNATLVTAGTAQTDTSVRKFTTSSSMKFDGNSDYIKWYQPGGLGGGDFTVEMWIYILTGGPVNQTFWSCNRATNVGFNMGINSQKKLSIYATSPSTPIVGTSAFALNTWIHVALVRNNGTITFYENGTAYADDWATTNNFTGDTFMLGDTANNSPGSSYLAANSGEYWNGYIQDFRFVKKAVYTANFTAPTAELGVGL